MEPDETGPVACWKQVSPGGSIVVAAYAQRPTPRAIVAPSRNVNSPLAQFGISILVSDYLIEEPALAIGFTELLIAFGRYIEVGILSPSLERNE